MAASQHPSALLENLVEFAPDALLVVDDSGAIMLANRTAAKLFGFEQTELLGSSIERLIPERLRSTHAGHRLGYSHNPRMREMGAAVSDLLALRKDGSEFPVEIRLSPVRLDGVQLVVAAVRDVTDRRHAAEVLRAAQQEADRSNAAKGRLLATASHDLRQPLQALQLLNAALQEQVTAPDAQELLARQSEALDSMAHLLNSLLDLSRLEAGAFRPDIEEVSLVDVFGVMQRAFEPLAHARGLTFSVSAVLRLVRTDRTLFRQLLENLLANALKFTESGAIHLSSSMCDGGIIIEVSDSGIGIPADRLGQIFEEFFQLDRTRRQGVGLGLSIVKRIAVQLGFTLDASSHPGRGTTFRIGIPAAQVTTSSARGESRTRSTRIQKGKITGALVLLIEDDAAVRAATEFYLKTLGHTAIGAASIDAAESALMNAERTPDLIITDFHLGDGQNGIQAIARLREKVNRPLPALVLSGDTSPAVLKLAEERASRVLSKPVDARALVVEISRILESASSGSQQHAGRLSCTGGGSRVEPAHGTTTY